MTNLYENQPDGRQADGAIPVSRFRPRYRALTDAEKALHEQIKAKAEELEILFNQSRSGLPSTYKDRAIENLELSVMWAVKDLTS